MAHTTTAFSPEWFIKIAQMMHSPVEPERLIALTKLNTMLAQAKLSWEEVLQNGLKKVVDKKTTPAANPFEDLFRHSAHPTEKKKETHSYEIKTGKNIPYKIYGKVRIIDERMTSKNTPMLVVEVYNKNQSVKYTTMIVFKQHIIDRIKNSPDSELGFFVSQSDPPKMPLIYSLWA